MEVDDNSLPIVGNPQIILGQELWPHPIFNFVIFYVINALLVCLLLNNISVLYIRVNHCLFLPVCGSTCLCYTFQFIQITKCFIQLKKKVVYSHNFLKNVL